MNTAQTAYNKSIEILSARYKDKLDIIHRDIEEKAESGLFLSVTQFEYRELGNSNREHIDAEIGIMNVLWSQGYVVELHKTDLSITLGIRWGHKFSS